MPRQALAHLPVFEYCYVCGDKSRAGLHARFFWVDDHVEGEWTTTDQVEGWPGLIHGGAVAALQDEAAFWAMLMTSGSTGFTTRMELRYLKPIPVGTMIGIRASQTEATAKRLTYKTELVLPDGAIASTGTVDYVPIEDPAFIAQVIGRPLPDEMLAWLKEDRATRRAQLIRQA